MFGDRQLVSLFFKVLIPRFSKMYCRIVVNLLLITLSLPCIPEQCFLADTGLITAPEGTRYNPGWHSHGAFCADTLSMSS